MKDVFVVGGGLVFVVAVTLENIVTTAADLGSTD